MHAARIAAACWRCSAGLTRATCSHGLAAVVLPGAAGLRAFGLQHGDDESIRQRLLVLARDA